MQELWSMKKELRSKGGGGMPLPRRMSQRLVGSARSVEEEHPFDTWGSSNSHSARRGTSGRNTVVINVERLNQLRYIRGTEMQDARELEEAPIPERPQVQPTFASTSHLRSDDYWKSIFGGGSSDRAYCSWADARWFQALVTVAIIGNALLIGMETSGKERPVWEPYVKHMLLLFSLCEQVLLVLRIQNGLVFSDGEEKLFLGLDMVAVLGCVLDQWGVQVMLVMLMPDLAIRIEGASGTVARVLWLIRFLRVTRVVPSLHELLHGVLQALSGLFWVFVFVIMMLYIIAVLCTAVIGKGALDRFVSAGSPSSEDLLAVKEDFSSVGSSMFVLFATMSSGSLNPLEPLFVAAPAVRILFCIFYVYAGWTLLAVMTGSVSFAMIATKAKMTNEDEAREQERRQHVADTLADIFQQLDEDGSGSLDAEEFKMILKSPDVLKLLANNTNIKVQDLEDLWSFLDEDGSGDVGVDEFMHGFQWLNEDFKPKTLMRMQEKLSKDINDKRCILTKLVQVSFDNIIERVEAPLCKIHAVTEQVQVLGAAVSTLQEDYAVPGDFDDEDSFPGQADIDALEASLQGQIDAILERISRFEVGNQ